MKCQCDTFDHGLDYQSSRALRVRMDGWMDDGATDVSDGRGENVTTGCHIRRFGIDVCEVLCRRDDILVSSLRNAIGHDY